jgi:hypothetical protein
MMMIMDQNSTNSQDDIFLCKQEDDFNNNIDSTKNYEDKQIISELAGSGTIGVAAAAAILSSKNHSRHNYHFETNPAIRKRQQTRLLRKLNELADEYAARCGQQICIICCTPSNQSKQTVFKVFGTQPLESVVKLQRTNILTELDNHLKSTIIEENKEEINNSSLEFVETAASSTTNQLLLNRFELPSLAIEGIPTSLEKMTQCQLRMFIPLLLKYSTGRQKPGWNRIECKPVWWPTELPWANVRVDPRDEESKKKNPWTEVLKQVIRNCYKYHDREDLLNKFNDNNKQTNKKSLKTVNDDQQNTYTIIQQVESSTPLILQTESIIIEQQQQSQRLDFNMNDYHNLWNHHHQHQHQHNILTSTDMIINEDDDEDEEQSSSNNNNIIELACLNKNNKRDINDFNLVDSSSSIVPITIPTAECVVDYNDLQMIKHKRFRLGMMKNVNTINENK